VGDDGKGPATLYLVLELMNKVRHDGGVIAGLESVLNIKSAIISRIYRARERIA
jgi:hypothetical protein